MDNQRLIALAPASALYAQPFFEACARWQIETSAQINALLANVLHETVHFERMRESFDYRVDALIDVFGRHITPEQALWLGRKKGEAKVPEDRQQTIANIVYANRHGNGNEDSGDGWRYRGRGGFQLTFRNAYAEFSRMKFGDERLLEDPDAVAKPELAMESAAWYFVTEGCLTLADEGRFDDVCRKINPALEGIELRRAYWNQLQKMEHAPCN